MNRAWYSVACAAVLLSAAPAVVRADNDEVVDYRRHIMRTLGEHAQALALTVEGKAPAENFNLHVKALALTSAQALKAFAPRAEGGNARPEVWQNWTDFAARMNELVTKLASLDKRAQTGGMATAVPELKGALTCEGCHEVFRTQHSAARTARVKENPAVAYRRHIMGAIDAQASAVGQILSTEIPDTNLAAHFDVLAVTAAGALKAFEAKVPGGEAKSEVWSRWPEFEKHMQEFAQNTAATAAIAREQGSDAALTSAMKALTCKNCHDLYRDKK
jgi:cytochrome c556